jgi:aminomethyltransferase
MVSEETLALTPLNALHDELKGKMVPFAGYRMPVQYPTGIIKEHQHTREHAGLFDVSHMGQVLLTGKNVDRALERLVPVDIEALDNNKQTYALFTNEQGGILDDLIITRWADDKLFVVVNAACKDQDIEHIKNNLGPDIKVEPLIGQALLALQGPTAKDVMLDIAPDTRELVFLSGCHTTIAGAECYITRSGYTGEDGFEISLSGEHADKIARHILANKEVLPIGLGARDSLRLEVGLCLYGHDMNTETSPVEASLSWSIAKSRRTGGDKEGGFPGATTVLKQLAEGVSRKRIGLLVTGRVPVREGAELQDANGTKVGVVTSGGFGATLGAPVAMGYVQADLSAIGTQLNAIVRGKPVPVQVAKMPFVPQRYYRG